MSLLIALYLILVIALPLTLSGAISYRSLPRTTTCPLCGTETLRIRSRWLNFVSLFLRGQEIQRRWCVACLWEGASRVPERPPARHSTPRARGDGERHTRDTPPGLTGEAIGLRDLEIDGLSWRVLLQCWHETDQWYGRLLFIAPSGRLWIDNVEPMRGASTREVMGKALALPDRTLACRLRELISD